MTPPPPAHGPAVTPPTAADAAPWCEVLAPDGRGTRRVALQAEADGGLALALRAPAGAETLQLPLGWGDRLWLRAELPVGADGRVQLALRRGADGQWRLAPALAELRLLAPEAPPPPLPLPIPSRNAPWQVALLIDRTTRWFAAEGLAPDAPAAARTGLLLADPTRWGALAGRLRALLTALGDGGRVAVQWAVLGFADTPIPEIAARDLQPGAPAGAGSGLGPGLGSEAGPEPVTGEKRFRPWPPGADDDGLAALTATPGGDWVDALAEALLAAVDLPWSPAARRLVVLCGDSPGHALLHPLPGAADAQAREHDVDLAAGLLYAAGIELLTLWQRPPAGFSAGLNAAARALLEASGAQYRRLASGPTHALEGDRFDPAAVAAALCGRSTPLARGISLGWVEPGEG